MQKLLPPLLFMWFAILITVVCWATGSLHTLTLPYSLFGIILIIIGLSLSISGKRLFKRLKTNIMTFDEPDVLVTEGVFKFTRNPMYLGFVVALLGVAVLTGAAISSLLLTALFALIVDRWYIAYEEQMMTNKFGPDYSCYCKKVRRWI
ncbi:methyltransferase family protein [Pseudoalteromonas sp. T1lg65]|uniref:methyltransferase family protein n=1 Tax=Pseudoalteromonas sp. T1lg65 TaxID=2077101 RepID=UPI003F7A3076